MERLTPKYDNKKRLLKLSQIFIQKNFKNLSLLDVQSIGSSYFLA